MNSLKRRTIYKILKNSSTKIHTWPSFLVECDVTTVVNFNYILFCHHHCIATVDCNLPLGEQ
jgi:hypothetical protein